MNRKKSSAFQNNFFIQKVRHMIVNSRPYSTVALVFLAISLAAILIIGISSRQYGYSEGNIADTYDTRRATGLPTSIVGRITPGSSIVQGFRTGNTHVTRIDLITWAYSGDNSGFLHIELRDADSTIAYWNYNMALLNNQEWIELSLDHPLAYDTMNKDLYLVISSLLTDSKHATSFMTVAKDVYPEGDLYIDGSRQDADLQFIVYGTGRINIFTRTRILVCVDLTILAELILYSVYRRSISRRNQIQGAQKPEI